MPSFKSTVLAAAAAFALQASAAANTTDYRSLLDISAVGKTKRGQWCQSQKQQCPGICGDLDLKLEENDCDSETLTYNCICEDGVKPDASEYTLTLPYFMCTELLVQCRDDCPLADENCYTNCAKTYSCGATNPKKYNSSSTATADESEKTGSDDEIFGDLDGDEGSFATQSVAQLGRVLGFTALTGAMLAGFSLL